METRIERDLLGEKAIAKDAYYGIQTQRALENFPISGIKIHEELARALVIVKKANAIGNKELENLDEKKADAIIQACDEILDGKFMDQFVVDAIQGGAGTSANMNANEVISNRAIEILGGEKGTYSIISPNSHVNMAQSTNDVFPTAMRIAVIKLAKTMLIQVKSLYEALGQKAEEFDDVLKIGRTHLQDAVPIRLGQEFMAYSKLIERDYQRIKIALDALYGINIGATAVGTGLNADAELISLVVKNLKEITGLDLYSSPNMVDATQNVDVLAEFSGSLRVLALNISKIANDLRLMSSGPRNGLNEINLPPVQPGSSIMPGKVNPVMAEVVNQVAFQVIGNDQTVALGAMSGQLELNVMEPVMAYNIIQSTEILTNVLKVFREKCIEGISANRDRCRDMAERSLGIVTALVPYIGYEEATKIAKEVMDTNKRVPEIVAEKGLLDEDQLKEILDPINMTQLNGKKRKL